MEKKYLIEVMESVIALDEELKAHMAQEEARLNERAEAGEQTLPELAKTSRQASDAQFEAAAEAARKELASQLAEIEQAKQARLAATEAVFHERRQSIIQRVIDQMRGDKFG